MPVLPMFPLGTVVVPGMLVPLHVFEERYRRLVADCLAGDPTFGIVLIERGSEVGGGDVRTDVGTAVRIVRADALADGRYALAAVGLRRVRVDSWLEDDPYPRAAVSDWPDEDEGDLGPPADDGPPAEVTALLRRAAALRAELGEPAPPLDVELTDDRGLASYQAVALAPLGPTDRQALLATPSAGARFARLRDLLAEEVDVLAARLAAG